MKPYAFLIRTVTTRAQLRRGQEKQRAELRQVLPELQALLDQFPIRADRIVFPYPEDREEIIRWAESQERDFPPYPPLPDPVTVPTRVGLRGDGGAGSRLNTLALAMSHELFPMTPVPAVPPIYISFQGSDKPI